MKNHLIGKIVMQRKDIGTIIGYRKDAYSEYITIEWDTRNGEDKRKNYQFPKIFLTKEWEMSIESGDVVLDAFLNAENAKHCCQCGEYSPDGHASEAGYICEECAKFYQRCPVCSTYVKHLMTGLDGQSYCRKCLDVRYPLKRCELVDLKAAPTIYIRTALPCECTHIHQFFCVDAKVIVIKGRKCSTAHINMHYCETCNKFYITKEMFERYQARYGYICLPRDLPQNTSAKAKHSFQESTILSEWGYSTSLSQSERRNILILIMSIDKRNKSDISSILSVFARTRTWQPQAQLIWGEDLEFVDNYDLKRQPLIDLTRFK